MMKKVSILMGIYNCADTLGEAIQSIVTQTYNEWELILCDDGSSDKTFDIAYMFHMKYPDKIKLIRNSQNLGLNQTLNRCLKAAEGEYIARQDGDDISLPDRIQKEIQTLEKRKDLAFISTGMILFDDEGEWGITKPVEFPDNEDLMQTGIFAHAASMIRKNVLLAVGGYSVSKWLLRVEDYHLWYKLYKEGYRGANLKEPLYRCRDDRDSANRRKYRYRVNESYVRWLIFRDLKLRIHYFPYIFRPLVIGLLPQNIYLNAHRKRFQYK